MIFFTTGRYKGTWRRIRHGTMAPLIVDGHLLGYEKDDGPGWSMHVVKYRLDLIQVAGRYGSSVWRIWYWATEVSRERFEGVL